MNFPKIPHLFTGLLKKFEIFRLKQQEKLIHYI